MHILVTRPENDSRQFIKNLAEAGHEVSHFPLLDIVFIDNVKLPDIPPQAVLITSANGARGLARHPSLTQLTKTKVICVGPASQKAAESAGFNDIEQAQGGDVTGVINHVRTHLKPQDGPLLYASGEKTTGDIVGELGQSGFSISRAILYQAIQAERLPASISAQINADKITAIALFSPRTAKIWISLAKAAMLSDKLPGLKHYCLSQNVANVLIDGVGKSCDITICKKPDTKAMLAAIGKSEAF